jgi:hypothetical protein
MKPLTLAIRELLAKNGDLTHSDAVPQLLPIGMKGNFEVAEYPGDKSEELKAMEQYQIDWEDAASVQSVVGACKLELTPHALGKVKREAAAHRAWKLQENQFNVTKNSWKKEQSGSVSAKPTGSRNVRAKAAAAQKAPKTNMKVVAGRRGRPPKKDTNVKLPSVEGLDQIKALQYVEDNGGRASVEAKLEAAEAKLEAAKVEVEALAQVLALHAELVARIEVSSKVSKVA